MQRWQVEYLAMLALFLVTCFAILGLLAVAVWAAREAMGW